MLIVTADEMLERGLELGGYDLRRQSNVLRKTNLRRFRSLYASNPVVYSQIFEDLQTSENPEARVEGKDVKLRYFLGSFHFLNCYPTEARSAI
jgi:hypothetical protein